MPRNKHVEDMCETIYLCTAPQPLQHHRLYYEMSYLPLDKPMSDIQVEYKVDQEKAGKFEPHLPLAAVPHDQRSFDKQSQSS
ncbi:MAG: hypothetical protein GY748_03420 [Planctomycetaceae bacterium]|nr:hypothetical protein [Planctomycetaceae bacterium]